MRFHLFVACLLLSAMAQASNFLPVGNAQIAYIGFKDAPSAASAVAASSATQLVAISVPVPVTFTGVRFNSTIQSGFCQVGLYDNSGNKLAASTEAACPAPGAQGFSFTSSVAVSPGIYYLAVGADNITQTFGKASGNSIIGCNNFLANVPMGNVTLPGTSTANCLAMVGVVTGGITQ